MFNLKPTTLALALWAVSARAGTVQWSGIFNATTTVADFDKWSFANQIEPWQYYIHGTGSTETYLGISSEFKNPADTSSAQGLRTTIDGTAFWNGQTMERTEVIPQTKANLGTGHLYYHFSLSTSSTNAPNPNYEHQIAFFESHFTELKYGTLSGASAPDNTLRWLVGGQTKWSVDLAPSTWYNFAYDIDFAAGTVGLWASTGGEALAQVVENVAASTSTNSADWHVGVLRLPNGGSDAAAEDFFWSGVYVESAPITTDVAGPEAGAGGEAPASSSSSEAVSSTAAATSTEVSVPEPTEVSTTSEAAPEPTTTEAATTTEAPAPEPTTTEAATTTDAPEPTETIAVPTEPTTSAAEPTETATESAPEPTESATESVPEPTETVSDSVPEPTETASELAPEPTATESATESASEPTETATESVPEATETATESIPEPTETATESVPEATETATESVPEPTASAAEPTTTAAPAPTTAAPAPTTAAPAPTGGVKDANQCWREYNKCLDASQPRPDFTGCSSTRDGCLDGARYMRLARSGTLGRAIRR